MTTDIEMASRFLVAGILVLSSLTKLLNFRWFVGAVAKYELVPRGAVTPTALAVALVELFVGAMLIIDRSLPWSAYAALSLFSVFTVVIVASLARGKFDIACGCNGLRKKTKIGW